MYLLAALTRAYYDIVPQVIIELILTPLSYDKICIFTRSSCSK